MKVEFKHKPPTIRKQIVAMTDEEFEQHLDHTIEELANNMALEHLPADRKILEAGKDKLRAQRKQFQEEAAKSEANVPVLDAVGAS